MQLIPLKEKYGLVEDDISRLASFMTDGHSLEEIAFYFQDKLTIKQIFLMAEVIAREMFSMTLRELCPELVEERRSMSQEQHDEWQQKRQNQRILNFVKNVQDDLNHFEMELMLRRRA
ncbi:hypothetical protein ACYPKM_02840 [Pseudomonas aeruginosa]